MTRATITPAAGGAKVFGYFTRGAGVYGSPTRPGLFTAPSSFPQEATAEFSHLPNPLPKEAT